MIINSDTLGCTTAAGAAQLANYIAELEQAAGLVAPLDSAVGVCTELVQTKEGKIKTLEVLQGEGEIIVRQQKSIIQIQQQQIDADRIVIGSFEKDLKKAKRRNKTSLILGGVVAGILTGVIIAVAL